MRIKMPAVRIAQADVEMQQQHSDVLTCGACQKPFALGDIVKFIQHKVLACNKENYSCDPSGPLLESGDSDDGGVGVVNSRRPSISAPIKKASLGSSGVREARVLCTSPEDEGDRDPRCSTPKRSGRPPLPLNLEVATDDEESKRIDSTPPHSSPDEGPSKRLRTEVSDAQSNTTNSEPSNYVCSTCKARLHSAWRLVQHVQNNHGMKIYVDPTTLASSSSVTSSPGTSSSVGKNQSGSSTCSTSSSGCSSSGNPAGPATPLALGAPPRLGIPTTSPMVEPPIPLHNPFTVGGILRLPMEPPRHHPFPPSSMGSSSGSLFARPSSHNEHHFRMDQLVSEQFRLSQHHAGLNLAAAVAAASRVPPPHTSFGPPPGDRPSPILPPSSVARSPVAPPPPSLALSLEPQLDFYSQRLRQLAGTTSPGPNSGEHSSPSSRKLTPPFTSPNSSLQPPASLPPAVLNNNNNNNSTNNNNINSQSPNPRPRSRSPSAEPKSQAEEPSSSEMPVKVEAPTTPRSSSSPPSKPADFSMTHQPENMEIGDSNKIHACDYCGKKFRFQSNLLVHRRSHTGEKPYKCSVCNHACSQSSKLKRHMRVHRRSMTSGNEDGNSSCITSGNTNNEQGSNEGSIGTMEDDDDEDDDEEDMEDDEDEEEEEDEDEEMELEDEEGDEDDDIGGDAPEDLTTKSNSSISPTAGEHKGSTSPSNMNKVPSGSLVGEFMDKYGLSNIQQYSEAYKQALKESVGAHHIMRKEDLIHRSHLLSDNNNCKPPHRLSENGMLEKSAAALRFREEFAKNMMSGQPPLDLVAGHPGLFGSPFENPFDASKRLKLERDGSIGRGERDGLYPSMWLPAMAAHHREHMFGGNGSDSDMMKDNCKGSPSTSASLAAAAAAAAALNLGLPTPSMKKESRRNDTCEYCGKVFKNCSNLTVHRRSHTGEKPYKCELCSYACAQSSKLTRHMKTHGRMGKDVYRCRFCEMPFSVPSTLEKHMRKCVVNQNIKVDHMMPSMLGGDSNIKVEHMLPMMTSGDSNIKAEHMLPMMTSGDEDSVASTPKDAATT